MVRDSNNSDDNSQLIRTKLVVEKDVSMNSNVGILGDVNIDGNLKVRNYTEENKYIINTTTTDYTLIVAEDLSLNGRMFVEDDVSLNSKLYVQGQTILQDDVSMNSSLYVQDDVSFNHNFYVNNKTILNKDTTMNSQLYVHNKSTLNNDVSMNSRLYVQDDVSMNSQLYVHNKSTLNSDVSMNSGLYVQDDVSMNSQLYVKGKTIHDNDVSMNKRLYVEGDVLVNRNLAILGDVSFGAWSGGELPTNRVDITGSVSIHAVAPPQTTLSDVSLSVLDVYRKFGENQFLKKNGIVFKAGYTHHNNNDDVDIAESGIRIGEGLLNENGSMLTRIPLSVYANGKEYLRLTEEGDLSANNVILHGDVSMNGKLYLQGQTINNHDVSMNSRLYVQDDVSLNSQLYVKGYMGINKPNPSVALDVSYTDAIRIPRGTTVERPIQTNDNGATEKDHGGYIRYNTETHQFEGFGPGDAWGSLGGVINVAQNTKISAAEPNADSSNNELRFYTTDLSYGAAIERMRITKEGDVSMNHALYVHETTTINGDVSMNSRLYVEEDISLNGNINLNGITLNGHGHSSISIGGVSFTDTSWNTAIGTGAGTNNGTGITNTYLGHNTKQDNTMNYNYSTAIGYNATITKDNQIVLGETNSTVSIPGNMSITGDADANSFNAISDMRYKENIEMVDNALEKINAIRGVNFNFITDDTKKLQSGVLAQEVAHVIPEIVNTDNSERWTVNYGAFVPYLIESIKTMSNKITTLQDTQTAMLTELDNIKRQNEELNEKISNLE